ncbi:sulfite exporter TauE/SafE family protein [Labrenzia sp. PHM005]|uniref:sulfite exporter TauE/SafE family protein n=1 Tax=Labrenzia sp. PHM005 TaxID=2590016 RepID=UPI0011402E78|nr:sulfite exporter TauE/SafE family protein [Labrenzia sp. PHM005]QDG75735.1 sulfite exporter TauE/SafE family protein [Labrenzia sp. PHM005]
MFDIFASYSPDLLLFLAGILFIAGYIRGFAGFGAGMIFMPVAASVMLPSTAAATFLFIDSIVSLPLVRRAIRLCDWSTVLPAVFGSVIFVHAGAWMLANMDVLALRWIISFVVVVMLALVVSGWRYQRQPTRPVSFGVGAVSGILGGVSQVSAPPVAAFWLSSNHSAEVIRANLILFFPLASIGTFIAYILNGFFTLEVGRLLVVAVPVYGISLFLGSRAFKKADQRLYRWIANLLIALAALASLPALDPVLRQ